LARNLAIRRLVSDGRELRTDTTAIGRWLSMGGVRRVGSLDLVGLGSLGGSALTLLDGLALSLLFLLASLPFLANLLEF
jgi:hypothetical protein